jgi:hypothetical protein
MTTLKDFRSVERSRLEYALLGLIVLVFVFGAAKLLGQTGMVAGWAALLTYLAEAPGSLRQRAAGMMAFAVFGFIQMLLVAWVGSSGWPLLLLLFAVSFACSWMMGYGARAALVGFVGNIWITLMPGLGVAADLVPSLVGYVAGSLLVVVASTLPRLFRGEGAQAGDADEVLVFESRSYRYPTLTFYSLVRALAIALGGLLGQQVLELNQLWIALTANLILPPALKTTWARGLYRALGTVLGGIVGYLLVRLAGENTTLLLVIEVIAAFLLLYTAKGFIYGVFVFFLSIFIVTQIGLQGVDMARFGGNERIIATLIGIGIAFVTTLILQFIVKRDTYKDEQEAAAG